MPTPLVMHVDEAPWTEGGPVLPESYPGYGEQLIGDLESGPWVFVIHLAPGFVGPPHAHDRDEIMYILEGEMITEGRSCGPGTVIYLQRETKYSFTVGPKGVRFLNMRPAPAMSKCQGEEEWKNTRG